MVLSILIWNLIFSTLISTAFDTRHPGIENSLIHRLFVVKRPLFPESRFRMTLAGILFSWLTLAPCFLVSPFHSNPADILSCYLSVGFSHPRPAQIIRITHAQNYRKIHRKPRPARLYLLVIQHRNLSRVDFQAVLGVPFD